MGLHRPNTVGDRGAKGLSAVDPARGAIFIDYDGHLGRTVTEYHQRPQCSVRVAQTCFRECAEVRMLRGVQFYQELQFRGVQKDILTW